MIAAIGITLGACKKIDDFNTDDKSATKVPSSTLFANALRNLADQDGTPSVNENVFRPFAQYWTETTYPDESNYDITTRQIPDYEFRTIYRDVLSNLKEAKIVIAEETTIESSQAEKNNKTAVTEILSVFAYQREVDIFGNVPYDEALDIDNIQPVYDDAKTIYTKLFDRLDAAIALIDVGAAGFTDGDLVYGGDMALWKKFANGLKLKMAIGVSDVPDLDPAGKINSAIAGGLFDDSGDNAKFAYLSSSPNTNQVWVELVNSGRFDWVAANTIVDIMNNLNDPRRPLYFDDNLGVGTYVGGPYGDNNSYGSYTHITPTIQTPDFPGILMTYSEIQFYLAEAGAKFSIGDPALAYSSGITASIVDDWGGSAADAATYLTQTSVVYDQANFKEKIATQSWLASYSRGLIGWTTWRRLDFPAFNAPAITGNPFPYRYTYSSVEQTLNGANYTAAAAAIGGDNQQSKIFWDKQ